MEAWLPDEEELSNSLRNEIQGVLLPIPSPSTWHDRAQEQWIPGPNILAKDWRCHTQGGWISLLCCGTRLYITLGNHRTWQALMTIIKRKSMQLVISLSQFQAPCQEIKLNSSEWVVNYPVNLGCEGSQSRLFLPIKWIYHMFNCVITF